MESIKDMPQLTPEEDEKASMFALQLAMGSILPITVNAAMELELLEIIVKAGTGAKLSPTDVVSRMPTENPEAVAMVDRILRLLAAYEVVSCSVETGHDGHPSCKYGAAPVCKYLIKNEDGVSLAALSLANHDKINMESWKRCWRAASLREGPPDDAVRAPTRRSTVQQASRRGNEGPLYHLHEEAGRDLPRLRRRQRARRRRWWHRRHHPQDHLQASAHQGHQLRPPSCHFQRTTLPRCRACRWRHV